MAAFFVTVIVTSNKVEVNSIDAIHHYRVPAFCLNWLNFITLSTDTQTQSDICLYTIQNAGRVYRI